MTEKHFTDIEVSADIGWIRLYTSDEEYEDYDGDEVLNMLNDSYEENEELKKKLAFLNELNKPYDAIIKENQRLKKENHNRRALLVDELRGLFQMYLTQCRSISEEAIITLIRNDVKKRVFEVFDE